jgi:hypothetical protein
MLTSNATLQNMKHRHIDSCGKLSAAAVDDIIDRGGRADWAYLRDCSRTDESIMEKIRRVCAAHMSDTSDQKYHLWSLYAG